MKKKCIQTIDLENGLQLNIFDNSKKIAGDRFYVCVIVSVEVEVNKKWFDNKEIDDDRLSYFKKLIGTTALFEKKKERNFIDARKKDQTVEYLRKSIVNTIAGYLAHKDFPKKLILKKAGEAEKKNPGLFP